VSASLIEARASIASVMLAQGFATAAKSMQAGETYVSDFHKCGVNWAEYIASNGDRFFDEVEGVWFTAPKKLKPRNYN